ncbi:sirohydrochlorin chelatase [Streptomyces sp. NPDC051940]|uniref:sirohydrochlorin chelatase n=1 Tax=Streptomyces sp. NPDC051940 TaxID=3155675 RepID=UPI003433F127
MTADQGIAADRGAATPSPLAPDGPLDGFPGGTASELFGQITAQASSRLRQLGRLRAGAPPTLVAVAHGSRHPRASATVRALLDAVRTLRPGLPVRLGHIELNEPLLTDTLAAVRGPAVLVPLLFTRGHHVTHDLPQALAAAPRVQGRIAAPLGPHPLLASALHARLTEAGWTPAHRRGAGVVLAAAGSRSPDSAADTARTAALLSDRLGGVPVQPAYASACTPTLDEAVSLLRARGCRRIAVASCFAAPGLFASRMSTAAPWISAAPLGTHPALARLVLRRYDETATAAATPGAELASA